MGAVQRAALFQVAQCDASACYHPRSRHTRSVGRSVALASGRHALARSCGRGSEQASARLATCTHLAVLDESDVWDRVSGLKLELHLLGLSRLSRAFWGTQRRVQKRQTEPRESE